LANHHLPKRATPVDIPFDDAHSMGMFLTAAYHLKLPREGGEAAGI
jgi:hypothetical protein